MKFFLQSEKYILKKTQEEVKCANLEKFLLNASNDNLSEMFYEFRTILRGKLNTDGVANDFGSASFEDPDSAKLAGEILNKFCLGDKQTNTGRTTNRVCTKADVMVVESLGEKLKRDQMISMTKCTSKKNQVEMMFNSVCLKNFGMYIEEQDLLEICQPFGTILSAKVMTDETGVIKGYGLVSFEDPDSAKLAVEGLNGICLGDRYLFAERPQAKTEEIEVMAVKGLDEKLLPSQMISMPKLKLEKTQIEKRFNLTSIGSSISSVLKKLRKFLP